MTGAVGCDAAWDSMELGGVSAAAPHRHQSVGWCGAATGNGHESTWMVCAASHPTHGTTTIALRSTLDASAKGSDRIIGIGHGKALRQQRHIQVG